MKDIPKLKQSTIERHEVKVEKHPFIIAMDSNAESEAKAFAEWVSMDYSYQGHGWWSKIPRAFEPHVSTKELYELYKKSK